MYQLRVDDQVATEHQDGARVVGGAAVVGRGEERDEHALREALEACAQDPSKFRALSHRGLRSHERRTVHDTFVRADNHLQVVCLAELLDAVRPKGDQPGTTRVGAQP